MQANCPQCAQKIAIDDAKVPDRPFSVRCPKCQNVVKLPGKGGAEAAAVPPTTPLSTVPSPAPAPVASSPAAHAPAGPDPSRSAAAPDGMSDEVRARLLAQLQREMKTGGEAGAVEKALVVFPEAGQGTDISQTLTRLGYSVDTIDDFDEGARQLEQGAYAIVATARIGATPGKPESLYQRLLRLSPEARRRLFVVLVGDEFRSGDSTQGFATLSDLVLNPKDAGAADGYIRAYQVARRRLFQPMEEARKRVEAAVI